MHRVPPVQQAKTFARHGVVLAYLDEDGIRLADVARIAGRTTDDHTILTWS